MVSTSFSVFVHSDAVYIKFQFGTNLQYQMRVSSEHVVLSTNSFLRLRRLLYELTFYSEHLDQNADTAYGLDAEKLRIQPPGREHRKCQKNAQWSKPLGVCWVCSHVVWS